MKNILSVDYDFFVREDPMWDYGHDENSNIFKTIAWFARYGTQDLYEECDFKYADFYPIELIERLKEKGFLFSEDIKIGIADSHKDAYDFVKEQGRCDLYNFDAHHDMYKGNKVLDCGNWLAKLIKARLVAKAIWVKPRWLKEFGLGIDHIDKLKQCFWEDLPTQNPNIKFDAVFFCRSGAWVPPHHDADFLRMASCALRYTSGRTHGYGDFALRKCFTREEAKKQFDKTQEMVKKFRMDMKRDKKDEIPRCKGNK